MTIPKLFVAANAEVLSEDLPNFLNNCQITLLNQGYNIISLTTWKGNLIFLCKPVSDEIVVDARVMKVTEEGDISIVEAE